MFDVGMGEIGLIAVIALLVLGPERLPGAARTAGALLRKARQGWQSVRSEIERELAAEELKRTMKETAAAADPRTELHEAMRSTQESVQAIADAVSPTSPAPAPSAPPPPAAADETHERG
jgi:sec-independent protein translocase protein TatB